MDIDFIMIVVHACLLIVVSKIMVIVLNSVLMLMKSVIVVNVIQAMSLLKMAEIVNSKIHVLMEATVNIIVKQLALLLYVLVTKDLNLRRTELIAKI